MYRGIQNPAKHLKWSRKDKSSQRRLFNIHGKTPVLVSLFNKVLGLKAGSVIEKRLQRRCFPVNIAKYLRATILKNICERLLLEGAFNKK